MMKSLSLWIAGTRPRTWIASAAPICMGSAQAITVGSFDAIIFLFTLLTALAIQVGTNLANDYFDCIKGADTKERKGPLRLAGSSLVSPERVKHSFIIAFSIAALLGMYLVWQGGIAFAALLSVSILLGIAYTGGPYPLAYRGWGDLFVLTFFGPIATGGTYYLQTQTLTASVLLSGFGCGLMSTAILVMNNLRDVEEDRKAGKNTLVVRFGGLFGKCEYLFCITLATLLPFLFIEEHPFALIASSILIPALPLAHALAKKEPPYPVLFGKTAQLLFFYTLLFCIGWML